MRAIWGVMALLSVGGVIASAAEETGRSRIAALFQPDDVGVGETFATQSEIVDLTAEIVRLRSETRLLALEKEAMATKIAALESELGPITGSISDAGVAAEAAVEAASAAAEDALEAAAATDGNEAPEAESRPVRTLDIGMITLPADRKNGEAPNASPPNASLPQGVALPLEKPEMPAAKSASEPAGDPETEAATEDTETDLASLASPAARVIPSSVGQTRFAIELGMTDSMKNVRELWKKLSNDNDILIGRLEPMVAIAEEKDKIRVRLLAGPFSDAADAIQLCTLLIERGVDCRAVRSEGQRLVMR